MQTLHAFSKWDRPKTNLSVFYIQVMRLKTGINANDTSLHFSIKWIDFWSFHRLNRRCLSLAFGANHQEPNWWTLVHYSLHNIIRVYSLNATYTALISWITEEQKTIPTKSLWTESRRMNAFDNVMMPSLPPQLTEIGWMVESWLISCQM